MGFLRYNKIAGVTGFNGGKSQINFNGLQIGGDYAFLNAFKHAQIWSFSDGTNAAFTPDLFYNNGYPTSLTHPIWTVFYVPTQASRPGNYVIKWTGNGTIALSMNNTQVSGSLIGSGGGGRYEFSTTDFRFDVRIAALPVTNLMVYHIADETALVTNGEVFGVKFKQRLAEARFGVLRFMNWQNGNTPNQTLWNTRKPAGYVFYEGYQLKQNLYVGVTSNSGNAYSITSAPGLIHSSTGAAWTTGGPLDKDTIHVLFNASATTSGTCSFNIFGSGAKNILDAYGNALFVDNNTYPVGGDYQSLATMFYDAALGAWMKLGGDGADHSQGRR